MHVLVTAASRHGATRQIAHAIRDVLDEHGFAVSLVPPEELPGIERYDAVVLGSSVYAGRWLESATQFVARTSTALAVRPVWLFSSGPVGNPSRRLVRQMTVDPLGLAEIRETTGAREHRLFAGRLDRQNVTVPQRAALLAFRGFEGDFRDWSAIRAWAEEIAAALALEGESGRQSPSRLLDAPV
jgi:menaquinone-dependent protoporphyrinogen oxidase